MHDMKNHRIGNDINVKWSIFSEGAPYNLEGLQVTLYLKDSLGKRAVTGFSLQENNVLWRFAGKDQTRTGRYSLELVINEGKSGMITTDICNFVNLVQHSCMIGGSDASNIETDSMSLTSDLGSVPVIIDESLSEVSENAIANKAVTKELKKKVNKTDLATINGQSIAEGGNIVIQGSGSNPDLSEYAKKTEVAMSLTKKVDKEEGKGLSSNDFTTTEKNKLASLANYNDSGLRTEINKKQDALISGTNIKTVNGQSILGEGNIEIKGSGATPDWDAKEGEEGYIKNRTHYLEWTTLGTIDVTNAKSGDVIYLDFSVTADTKMRNQTRSNRLFYDIPTGGGTFDLPVSGPSVRAVMHGDRTLQIVSDPYGIPNIIEFGDVALWPLAEEYIPHTIARTEQLDELSSEVNKLSEEIENLFRILTEHLRW